MNPIMCLLFDICLVNVCEKEKSTTEQREGISSNELRNSTLFFFLFLIWSEKKKKVFPFIYISIWFFLLHIFQTWEATFFYQYIYTTLNG
jgi:hypothetical protein